MIAKWLVGVEFIALPNLLFGRMIAPEFLQGDATADNLSQALMAFMRDPELTESVSTQFKEKHMALRCHAGKRAALIIKNYLP